MAYDLLRLLESPAEAGKEDMETFFHILGRTYDEDLISRVLVYAMNRDAGFVRALLSAYTGGACPVDAAACDLTVYPEKSMGRGRADIFAVLRQNGRVAATVTIENKIFSTEHDDQTQTYYDWVTGQREYQEAAVNAFFYLRPAYNTSVAVCPAYRNITYTDVRQWLTPEDEFIRDFRKHIDLYLGETTMELSEKQATIIQNYEKLSQELAEATSIYAAVKNQVIDRVQAAVGAADPDVCFDKRGKSNPLGPYSLELYKAHWYKENEYYFYTEMLFDEARMERAKFQCVVKEYPKKGREGAIQRFLESDALPVLVNDGPFHVWGTSYRFAPTAAWMSPEWQEELVQEAVEKLTRQLQETETMLRTFREFE